ncbi:DUF2165 domain-containing protein [Saccharopolyspora sp. HNM0986]|uniref:DUF2165 domain-containing protein n=1 Tax=Saccharopolyspora galaxeae TaxID=2781241 RepID=UPI001909C146|nr:DUF2165 domain-containing protein [Saccharopolyspora sp. HNM0986]MBK0866646.1 DUF2165 domain-containing protein [Saccharopolyspora sp. HNM0986]
MRLLRSLGSLRAVITALVAITAVQIGLIAFGNITDYGTNAEFVQHVFAMDTTFQTNGTMWRAITTPGLAQAGYLAVIVWEVLTAVVLVAAFVFWVRPGSQGIETARRLASLGWLLELLLFGGGFITIGGEWFQMWQSDKWNGLQPALQNLVIAGIGLVLVHLPMRESAER